MKIKPIKLPRDNGHHDFYIEWWYFNGHLQDKKGNQYAFMDCFFKINSKKVHAPHILPNIIEDYLKNGEYIHFAHSILSDISKKKVYKDIQNISLISKDSFKKKLLYINYKDPIVLDNFSNSEIIETSPNNFYLKTKNFNLELENNKKPLLENGKGYEGTPEYGSYYYSLSNFSVKGDLNINGKEIEVEGKAWMDHQWANTVYKKDKWTWFSIQLENNTEIVCIDYEKGGAKDINIIIDMIDKNEKQSHYKKAKMVPNKGKYWKSLETKARYPLAWQIKIPEAKIVLETEAILKDQEMIFGPMNYWEGPIKVVAKINSKKTKGKGFMELVGYPSDYNFFILIGKELEKNISNKIKKVFKK